MYPSGGNNAFGPPPYGQPTGVPGSSMPASLHFGGQYGATFATPQIGAHQLTSVNGTGMTSTINQAHGANSFAVSPSRGLYGQSQGAFNGRDLPSESARRYSDYVDISHSRQSELGNQLSFFRQQQLLQAQQQPVMDLRAADYLAARGTAIRHGSQDLLSSSYGMRVDIDPAMQGSRPLPGLVPGGATGRSHQDDVYVRGSSVAGYGVTLPPGRDYSSGKVLGGIPSDPGYGGGLLSRMELSAVGNLSTADHKEDRGALYKIEGRDEELRRDRERDREREREEEPRRDRERDRERERRERERDSERGRARELRGRDRTPPRSSRDHKASTGKRSKQKSIRKSSLRREASHRHHSPIKERRPYACKITPCSLVEVERDLTSICRRYPRLSISPEFSKLVVRWPMKELEISLSTPVSFEHDSVEISGEADASTKSAAKAVESGISESAKIVWNAKVVLMSGLSSDSLSELVSENSSGNEVHINNILRFAILRKDRSFMAIGGTWNAETDGGDPSVDEFSLVQTAIRCTRELVQIDLASCQQWNPFLEIHYDRVGEDGFHSYREVTVVFLPDIASCLPSPDVWRSQWFSRRKAREERILEMTSKKKDESGRKKDDAKGHSAAAEAAKGTDGIRREKDDKIKKEEEADAVTAKLNHESKSADKPAKKVEKENLDSMKKEKNIDSVNAKKDDPKNAEKVMKRKRDSKSSNSEDNNKSAANEKEGKGVAKVRKNEEGTEQVHPEVPETTIKKKQKKVVKKGSKMKTAEKEKEVNADDKTDLKKGVDEEPKNTTKKNKKNKIIPKKSEELSAEKEMMKNTDNQKNNEKAIMKAEGKEDKPEETKQTEEVENDAGKGRKELKSQDASVEKINRDAKTRSQKVMVVKNDNLDSGMVQDGNKRGKVDSSGANKGEIKLLKEKKEKSKPEEPPLYPGLFLVTKRSKNLNIRATTLSLDGLLDYNESDIAEATFELSLFAEVLYEMLQYKMGCLILAFLEKLRENYLNKKNQRKRIQEENLDKDNEKPENSSSKRLRVSETIKSEGGSGKPVTSSISDSKPQDLMGKVEAIGAEQDEQRVDKETEESEESEEDDPEEEPLDEDEEENVGDNDKSQEEEASEDEHDDTGKESPDSSPKASGQEVKTDDKKGDTDEKPKAAEKEEAPKQPIVNKVLLQAFHYFDCNSVGYIKVEDLRTIINNLGKFHSRRAVKELTRVAVLESNKNRDDRINYPELLKVDL